MSMSQDEFIMKWLISFGPEEIGWDTLSREDDLYRGYMDTSIYDDCVAYRHIKGRRWMRIRPEKLNDICEGE